MRALVVVATSVVLVLGTGTNAWASQLCPPKHSDSAPPGTETGDPRTDNSCNAIFDRGRSGSVVKTTSAGPTNGVVSSGQTITVTLRWHKNDFPWGGPAVTEDCVEIGGKTSKLSQEHGHAPLNGTDTFTYRVPESTGGAAICDRGVVWGYEAEGGGWNDTWKGRPVKGGNSGPETSSILCYTILAAATPEAPNVILFPIAAALAGGAGYVVVRRRRRRTPLHSAGRMTLNVGGGRHGADRHASQP